MIGKALTENVRDGIGRQSLFKFMGMEEIAIGNQISKATVFNNVKKELIGHSFEIRDCDMERPWGGFFVLAEKQAAKFVKIYFPGENPDELVTDRMVSPKILIVAPQSRLSWQYHHRRSEVWRVAHGEVGIVRSMTNEQGDLKKLKQGDQVVLAQGERHRLIGLSDYGIVAEIWQHTNANEPSNEEDIVRVEDDFGR